MRMGFLESVFGAREVCAHDDHVTNTIKQNFTLDKDGWEAEETDVVTCSKCGRYYFLSKGRKKQERGLL